MTAIAPPPVAYFPDVGLGILSWRAHRTLRRTLRTLADADMFSLFGESLIYFQEMCGEDRAIAREFNLRTVGGDANIGIRGGMKTLAESLQSQFRTVRLLMMAIRGDVLILLIANAVRFEGTAANDDSIFPHSRRRLH